jgi:sigma-B regulation protein RsbU (phosphoserine phosphatase)
MILSGTTVFLYTDGFTEAETIDHKQYGRDRMFKEAIRLAAQRMDSQRFVKTIRQTERTFVGGIPQMDDISLLAIKYVGNLENVHYHRSILLSNDVQEVPILAIFIQGVCEDMQFDELSASGVNLAIEEAVVNVMKYGYPEHVKGDILLEATADESMITFVLRDSGIPFDPTAAPDVDVDSYVAKRSIGGLGIHLIRHYMDGVAYERVGGQNVFTMRKQLKKNISTRDGSNH